MHVPKVPTMSLFECSHSILGICIYILGLPLENVHPVDEPNKSYGKQQVQGLETARLLSIFYALC